MMTRLLSPEAFSLETLYENEFEKELFQRVQASSVNVVDKNTVELPSGQFSIYEEGLISLCSTIGINYRYLKNLPDDLFAYNLNYFLRRAEDFELEIVFNEEFTILEAYSSENFRLSNKDAFDFVNDLYRSEEKLIVSLRRHKNMISFTLLGERFMHSDLTYFPSIEINIHDRIVGGANYSFGIYNWGSQITSPDPYLITKISRKDSVDSALNKIREDMLSSFSSYEKWAKTSFEYASQHTVEDPDALMLKILKEKFFNKPDKVLKEIALMSGEMTNLEIAKKISSYASEESHKENMRVRLEKLAGFCLNHITKDHRCKACLSKVEEDQERL